MLGILKVSIASKGRYGRKKQITSIVAKEKALETLLQDFRLKPIAEVSPFHFFINTGSGWE